MIRKLVSVLVLVGAIGSVSGCNTVDGMGRDIERAGEATSDTARDVKRKM